jgi:hypothetical protein
MLAVVSKFIEDDEVTQTVYVDQTTIHKNGNNVKMWFLFDYKKAQELAYLPLYMSIKRQNEFNCKEEQIKNLYESYHAKNMGGGKVIYNDNTPDNWSTVSPDSIDRKLWKFACGK